MPKSKQSSAKLKLPLPEVNSLKFVKRDLKEISRLGGSAERTVKFYRQYQQKGWTDIDVWNIDVAFAFWIVPRLQRFKEITTGFPRGETRRSWTTKLDKMIAGFSLCTEGEYFSLSDKKKLKQIEIARTLFSKHLRDLWY